MVEGGIWTLGLVIGGLGIDDREAWVGDRED